MHWACLQSGAAECRSSAGSHPCAQQLTLRCWLHTQAQAAAQQEEAARAHEMEMQALHQKHREALAAAEEKHQEESTQQRTGLEEQHEAGMQMLRAAAQSGGHSQHRHQQQLQALEAKLDSQVHSHALTIVMIRLSSSYRDGYMLGNSCHSEAFYCWHPCNA